MITTLSAEEYLEQCATLVDAAFERWLPAAGQQPQRLHQAMRYGVLGGGKRVRPALCLAAAEALGAEPQAALVPACAVELIHAYSLMHDDLPAMDNDDLRRGRPTTHIAFDEATAILAGDALQTLAFDWLSRLGEIPPAVRLKLVQRLATASGSLGMAGGQAIDLGSVGQAITLAQLEQMHRHKTGALIEASVATGALVAVAAEDHRHQALTRFASALGLAFQVQDDLLDVEGDTRVTGKPQGSDSARHKPTYPSLMGLDGARRYLDGLLASCRDSLADFGPEADPLRSMAEFVVSRRY